VTYSIVARDPVTGELGVAVQSHWFSVGSVVTWAQPGVGAVATQSIAEPAYGPHVLDRLAAGAGADAALAAEVGADEAARVRQVAVVDANGNVVAHTGVGCIEYAGDIQGEGYSVQANMMASADVWPAMASAYERAEAPLPRRLYAALCAGEEAGGDVRGRQSAALVVVPAEGEPWQRTVELRVEDDPEPLGELGRLLDLSEAYAYASAADDAASAGDFDGAAQNGGRALGLAPDNAELRFWAGLGMIQGGQEDMGAQLLRGVIAEHRGWGDLLERLEPEISPAASRARELLG
jgi:uncharacterized Ntn-hydrolase superfamily protein